MAKSVIILGAGPAGYAAALYGAQLGLQVTLVENAALGGTGFNTGAIPARVFTQAADAYYQMKNSSSHYGFPIKEDVQVDFKRLSRFKKRVINQATTAVSALLKKADIHIVNGFGRIKNSSMVDVRPGGNLQADAIVLACGGKDIVPPGFEPDGKTVLTSAQFLDLTATPDQLVILGGGTVGVEFAAIMAKFGKQVTLLEKEKTILPEEDADVAEAIRQSLGSSLGVEIRTGTQAVKIVSKGAGGVKLAVNTPAGVQETIDCEKLLLCVGRKPSVTAIGLENAEVRHDEDGIFTDETMQTNVPGIYAIGDLTHSPDLAHIAHHEAKIAMQNIAGVPAKANSRAMPVCVFAYPEMARVGLTEKEALARGEAVEVKKLPLTNSSRAYIDQQTEGFIKQIYSKENGSLVGCTIVGERAAEWIGESSLAVSLGLQAQAMADTIHLYPSLSEWMGEAASLQAGLPLLAEELT